MAVHASTAFQLRMKVAAGTSNLCVSNLIVILLYVVSQVIEVQALDSQGLIYTALRARYLYSAQKCSEKIKSKRVKIFCVANMKSISA